MLRKAAVCAVLLCAALVSGCDFENLPTVAQLAPVMKERGAVARQYWAATSAFQRARLGFKVRLEVAVGYFSACSPGGAGDQDGAPGGQQYQILADWEPVGVPPAEQGGVLQEAVPVIGRAFNDAGWSHLRPSTPRGLDLVATRQGITLSLDGDPANPAPLERDWIPAEHYAVAGPCIPVPAQVAAEFESLPEDSYGTVPTALPSVRIPPG
jgi:hypothetical protein